MENKIGYRVRIVAIFDGGSVEFKDEFFKIYEAAYRVFNYITLDGVQDSFNAPSTPREAYISLNAIDGDGLVIKSNKKNKHRLLVRI